MKAGAAGRQVRVAIHTLDFGAYSSAGQSTRLISAGSMVQVHLGPVAGGAVAQLGERLLCKQEAAGSSPVCSRLRDTDFRSLKNQAQMRGPCP